MAKNKNKPKQKKHSEKGRKINVRFIIILLSLVPLFFSALFQGGYFPWETYLTFLLAVPAIILFLLTKFRTGEGATTIRKSGADRGLFIYLLVTFVSLFFTVYFHATLTEFFKVLIYITLFYIVLNTIASEQESNFVLNLILALAAILSLLGILAYVGYRLNLQTSFFKFLSRNGFTQGDRVSSTLQYANTFAAFLIIPFFISISGFIYQKKAWEKLIYLLVSVLFLITFVLTQSRGALVAFVISLILFVFLLKGKDRKFSLAIFGLLLICVGVVIIVRKDVFLPMLTSFATRLKGLFAFFQGNWEESLGDRVYMLRDSLRILRDYPILGTGNGTYQYVYAKYRTIYFFSKFPHSIFFQVLGDLGILGGAAFIYMIFSLFKKGFRVIKENYSPILVGVYTGLAGMFLHALVDFDWSLMFMPMLFFFLFAVLIAYGKKEYFAFKCPLRERLSVRKKPVKGIKTQDGGKVLLNRFKTVGIVLSVVLTIVFLFQFLAAFSYFRAKGSIGLVEWQDTASGFKTAVALDPLVAEYHYDLANFDFTYLIPAASDPTQFVSEAESEYLAAIKRCPEFFLYHFELGRLYLQTSNQKAIEEFTRAVQLNPLDPGAHASLGLAYLQLKKDTSMSKIQFEEALRLDSENPDAYIGLGSLYEQLNDPNKALENYQLAIKYGGKNAYAYYRAGVIYENNGMLPEAVNNLFYAVKYNPNLAEARTAFEKYAPIITIAKPQNGEIIKVGSTYEISWLSSNEKNVEYYNIWLLPEQGDSLLIKEGVPVGSISYNWVVPSDLAPGSYRVEIYAAAPQFMQGKLGNWLSYEEVQINIAGE